SQASIRFCSFSSGVISFHDFSVFFTSVAIAFLPLSLYPTVFAQLDLGLLSPVICSFSPCSPRHNAFPREKLSFSLI
ncbi:MAG: hypothetical protein AABZ77_01205, partial [Chloroflexota bacterium]